MSARVCKEEHGTETTTAGVRREGAARHRGGCEADPPALPGRYKLRILEEIEAAGPGGAGVIQRREGLHSSHLTAWRRARRDGALRTLDRKRGGKKAPEDASARKVAQLAKELARTRKELRKAQVTIDVQGEVAGLLGFSLADGKDS